MRKICGCLLGGHAGVGSRLLLGKPSGSCSTQRPQSQSAEAAKGRIKRAMRKICGVLAREAMRESVHACCSASHPEVVPRKGRKVKAQMPQNIGENEFGMSHRVVIRFCFCQVFRMVNNAMGIS
jgi:hypothetical protein